MIRRTTFYIYFIIIMIKKNVQGVGGSSSQRSRSRKRLPFVRGGGRKPVQKGETAEGAVASQTESCPSFIRAVRSTKNTASELQNVQHNAQRTTQRNIRETKNARTTTTKPAPAASCRVSTTDSVFPGVSCTGVSQG